MKLQTIISNQDKIFFRITGVHKQMYNQMVTIIAKDETSRRQNPNKQKNKGRFTTLSNQEKVLLFLLYLRTYSTFLQLGLMFEVSESTSHKIFHTVENLIIQSRIFALPKKSLTFIELERIIIDAMEQAKERPTKHRIRNGQEIKNRKNSQKKSFSGKKKTHTNKAQITKGIYKSGKKRIVDIKIDKGKTHDKTLFHKSEIPKLTSQIPNLKKQVDKGYQGIQKTLEDVQLPYKKPRKSAKNPNPKLTPEQKNYNSILNSERVDIEHTFSFSGLKKYRILYDKYRGKGKNWSKHVHLLSGFYNAIQEINEKAIESFRLLIPQMV